MCWFVSKEDAHISTVIISVDAERGVVSQLADFSDNVILSMLISDPPVCLSCMHKLQYVPLSLTYLEQDELLLSDQIQELVVKEMAI